MRTAASHVTCRKHYTGYIARSTVSSPHYLLLRQSPIDREHRCQCHAFIYNIMQFSPASYGGCAVRVKDAVRYERRVGHYWFGGCAGNFDGKLNLVYLHPASILAIAFLGSTAKI